MAFYVWFELIARDIVLFCWINKRETFLEKQNMAISSEQTFEHFQNNWITLLPRYLYSGSEIEHCEKTMWHFSECHISEGWLQWMNPTSYSIFLLNILFSYSYHSLRCRIFRKIGLGNIFGSYHVHTWNAELAAFSCIL